MPEYGLTSPQLFRKDGATLGSGLAWNGEKWKANNSHGITSTLCDWSRTVGNNLTDTGGTMGTPGTQTLTFTKGVPQGVSGTNANHYLYISGGTGTAEAVLITGGTALSGAASGTITFTTANAHSGSWTIGSATAGIQEAIKIAEVSTPATVVIPSGTHTVYAPSRVRVAQVGIRGASSKCGAVVDASNMATGNVFEFHASSGDFANNSISDLKIYASTKTSGAGVSVDTAMNFHADKLIISGIPDGIVFRASFQVYVNKCWIYGIKALTGRGIAYNIGANLRISGCQINGDISGDVNLQPLSGIDIEEAGGVWITDCDVLGCGKSLYIHPGAGVAATWGFVINTSFDTAIYGVYVEPASTGQVQGWNFTNSWTASHRLSGVSLNGPTAAQVNGISFVNHRSSNNQFYGFEVAQGVNLNISDSQVWGNNQSNTASITAIQVFPNLSNVKITGNSFAPPVGFPKNHAAHISISAGTGDNIVITGNDVTDTFTVAPILFAATGTHNVIHSNLGVNTLPAPTVASASTLALSTIPYDVVAVTGTTTVNNITPGWEGRDITILKADAGTLSFSNSGNIVAPFSLDEGDVAICKYVNGGWWCK